MIEINPKFKILLVDDDHEHLLLLKEMLKDSTYNLLFASCGQDALNLLNQQIPDLILLDAVMPEISGLQVAQAIRKEYSKDLPIIIFTRKRKEEALKDSFKSGANDFILKPFEKDELIARIEAALKFRVLSKQNHFFRTPDAAQLFGINNPEQIFIGKQISRESVIMVMHPRKRVKWSTNIVTEEIGSIPFHKMQKFYMTDYCSDEEKKEIIEIIRKGKGILVTVRDNMIIIFDTMQDALATSSKLLEYQSLYNQKKYRKKIFKCEIALTYGKFTAKVVRNLNSELELEIALKGKAIERCEYLQEFTSELNDSVILDKPAYLMIEKKDLNNIRCLGKQSSYQNLSMNGFKGIIYEFFQNYPQTENNQLNILKQSTKVQFEKTLLMAQEFFRNKKDTIEKAIQEKPNYQKLNYFEAYGKFYHEIYNNFQNILKENPDDYITALFIKYIEYDQFPQLSFQKLNEYLLKRAEYI